MKKEDLQQEDNPQAYKKAKRDHMGLFCTICPPNQGENSKSSSKKFAKGWKDKTKRKHQYR